MDSLITLRQLESFCHIVREGSFSAAADKLYISQPSISQHIASLEDHFEVKVFIRRGRKVQLTPEGRHLYKIASEVLEKIDSTLEHFRETRTLGSGELSIGTSPFTGKYLLPSAMELFQKLFPMIRISLISGTHEKIFNCLKKDEIELAILGKDLNSHKDPDLIYRSIGYDKLVFAASASYSPKDTSSKVDPQSSTFISFKESNPLCAYFRDFKIRKKINFKEQLSVEDMEIARRLVREGLGICLISRLAISEDLDDQKIRILETLEDEKLIWEIRAIYHKTRGLSYAGWEMLKILEKMAGIILR